ncbi:DNase I-like protein [Schizophyllum commune H4-8]|uniref:DNA-(apurinic or apyrimidinic site) endonuclease n=1 Tax=Schizophyllum commune (strain H4-8 / FGSC 9210) TaxID=578458 RepID=D8Q2M0_SCHCM|nr:DNase I-like protein [Schizophyllum commune H4-8]KAI5894511.1 DNase I-like protein [Schizophyllum commune H4-8]
MKIMTWNINGIRTIPQYHPWNGLKSHKDILDKLDADIICFQEMKSSRQNLPKDVAVPPGYTSFFSFPTKKAGYSGVAIYVKDQYTPFKVEDHLCGLANATASDADRISPALSSYPMHRFADLDDDEDDPIDFKSLDAEGRTLVADFGLFVLINVYCPNDGSEAQERMKYKMDFHRMLSVRVRGLIDEGREVIVVGDLNAVSDVGDHCEGALTVRKIIDEARKEGQEVGEKEAEEMFYDTMPARRWLRDSLVEHGGPLVDVCKRFWPERKGMYTCWNTKISARASNYGARIDFILVTPYLLPLIKHADIQPDVKGSDHCPVIVEFHDEVDVNAIPSSVKANLSLPTGATRVSLQALMPPPASAPRLAAKNWDEYSGKQKLLDGFFKGGTTKAKTGSSRPSLRASKSASLTPAPAPVASPPDPDITRSSPLIATPGNEVTEVVESSSSASPSIHPNEAASFNPSQPPASAQTASASSSSSGPKISTAKRKAGTSAGPSKKQKVEKGGKAEKGVEGQTKLSAFFAKPKASGVADAKGKASTCSDTKGKSPPNDHVDNEDPDYLYALELSRQYDESGPLSRSGSFSVGKTASQSSQRTSPASPGKSASSPGNSASSWQDLLAAPPPPRCYVHDEPAREFTVNKKGENKGRAFYVCSRPVGPGYDKGRAERRREDVDPQYKCDFFRWKSDVRKEFNSKRGKG